MGQVQLRNSDAYAVGRRRSVQGCGMLMLKCLFRYIDLLKDIHLANMCFKYINRPKEVCTLQVTQPTQYPHTPNTKIKA